MPILVGGDFYHFILISDRSLLPIYHLNQPYIYTAQQNALEPRPSRGAGSSRSSANKIAMDFEFLVDASIIWRHYVVLEAVLQGCRRLAGHLRLMDAVFTNVYLTTSLRWRSVLVRYPVERTSSCLRLPCSLLPYSCTRLKSIRHRSRCTTPRSSLRKRPRRGLQTRVDVPESPTLSAGGASRSAQPWPSRRQFFVRSTSYLHLQF